MQDAMALASLIEHHELSHLLCLPSLYAVLLEQRGECFRSLQVAIVAGESCPPRLPALHHERLPATQLYNEYGPTEATVWSTVLEVTSRPAGESVGIGRPIEGARIYLLDEQQKLVPRLPARSMLEERV
jgi:non-ribosomal peptide synthetase component F